MIYRRNNGFTLVELLLGLTIFSIIAAMIYSTFSGAIKLNKRTGIQNEIFREANWTFHFMSQELENMRAYDFSNSTPDKLAFVGDQEKVSFLLSVDNELKRISYYLARPEQDVVHRITVGDTYRKNVTAINSNVEEIPLYYLYREEQSFVNYLSGLENDKDVEIIATHIQEGGLRFSYGYVETQGSAAMVWADTWTLIQIPMNVRVELDLVTDQGVLTVTRDILIPSGAMGAYAES